MESRTKYEVDPQTIIRLFEKAGIAGIVNIAPLGAGEFNSVYAVDAGGKAYAIKIAPTKSAKILTYEQEMIAQEVYYYSLIASQAKIRVPKIYTSDFSKQEIPTDYFIMERLQGKQIDQIELSELHQVKVDNKLAAMVAQLHTVKGDKFGYRQNELFDNWFLAIQAMVSNLIEDCRAFGRRTRRGQKLLSYINQNQQLLERVESSLVSFDLWPPNIFYDFQDGEINLTLIDPERCFWGDRIADFVCLDFMNQSLDQKSSTIEAYNQASAEPISVRKDERIRFAIMLGYLSLIMEVEKYARYTIFNYGFRRNVFTSRMLFSSSFDQLEDSMEQI